MAHFTRIEVLQKLHETGLVPLFYHPDPETAKAVAKACYDGGARLLEFTNRGDFAHEVFAELNRYALRELPGMALGVGSVQDGATAALFLQLGANFIVTPAFREDVARICNRRKVAWIPGCGTMTEIGQAEELGCDVVKLFPGELFGPGFIKAMHGPQPWTSVLVTGGVELSEESLTAWFRAGATAVGMGSKVFTKDIFEEKNYAKLTDLVRTALGWIRGAKVR